jgi:hypothetical protein
MKEVVVFKAVEQLVVPVVDALTGLQVSLPRPNSNGQRTLKRRIYRVSPIQALWPHVRVVILDWTKVMQAIERDIRDDISEAKAAGTTPPNFNLEREARLLERIKLPVEYGGVDYHGYYGWGSGVKRNQTLGLSEDVGADSGLTEIAEDASRYLRAFMPSSLYGGGHLNRARVLVLPDRSEFKGYMIADGFGLIKRSIAEALRDSDSIPIRLGRGRQNYLGWQRFSWDRIKEEATRLILENLKKVGGLNWVLTKLDAEAGGYKRRLWEADEEMLKHPYLKLTGNISIKKTMQELGTTVPLKTYVRVAVPSRLNTVVWGGDEKLICSRHPMDSWQSQMALIVDKSGDFEQELELISEMVLVQTTETSPTSHAKGIRAIVDDEIMGNYDLVVSEEDFKMLRGKSIKTFRNGKMKTLVISDMVIAFTQWYEAGCAFGIDPETWKSQGGDFDGDMGFLSPCSDYPIIWDTAREWLGRDRTWKIKKTRSPLAKRPEMLVSVFGNSVGFATNVVSTTFVVQPEDRQVIADELFAGNVLLQPTVKYLDVWCNKIIKVMTDGFKTLVNMLAETATLRKAQQVVSTKFGGTASWAIWGQEASPAFTHVVPLFHHQLSEETLEWMAADKDNRRQPEVKLHIGPQQYGATCSKIYELVQPWILEQYHKTALVKDGVSYSFLELLDVNPGSKYIGWAPHVPDKLLNRGLEMVREFSGLSRMVIWSSSEDVVTFKETWQELCLGWAAQFSSVQEAAYVLWRASHHATVGGSGAAAVFMGFPEEALQIVTHKPGLLEQQHEGVVALLVGVDYNFMGGRAPDLAGPVTVQVFEIPWRGSFRLAVVLDEPLLGMKESEKFPYGMIGMCAAELREGGRFYTAPEPGSYIARFKRNRSGKSYRAYLTPIIE